MGFCPKCNLVLAQKDVVCPECGYQRPDRELPEPSGIAYSGFSDFALVVGEVVSIIMVFLAIAYTAVYLSNGYLFSALVTALGALLSFSNFVVIRRVREISRKQK